MKLQIAKNRIDLSSKLQKLSNNNRKIAFVPTMGNLHEGHLALVREAKAKAEIVIISIFVNPKQFNNNDDYKSYPETLDSDIKMLEEEGADLLFIPNSDDIYQDNLDIKIRINSLYDKLCGKARPGHFEGVAFIVIKLLNLIDPDFLLLGLKDFQQYLILSSIIKALEFDTKIISVDTVREDTGLAYSSRNNKLSKLDRQNKAPLLHRELLSMSKRLKEGNELDLVINDAKNRLLKSGFNKIDYLEVLQENLEPYDKLKNARIFAAAFLGEVRLIDNLAF